MLAQSRGNPGRGEAEQGQESIPVLPGLSGAACFHASIPLPHRLSGAELSLRGSTPAP